MPIDEIEVIKQKLVDQIKPIGVYLFGSFANGTAHADSDFDFYIIVDDSEKDLHAVATSAYKAIRGVKQRPVDILVGTKSRFDERKNQFTVENEVFHKGVLLYGSARPVTGCGPFFAKYGIFFYLWWRNDTFISRKVLPNR